MPQFAGDVVLEWLRNEVAFIAAQRLGVFHIEIHIGCDTIGVIQRLGDCRIRFETPNKRDNVSPIALLVKAQRDKKINLRAGRKHSSKVKALGQYSDNSDWPSVEFDGLTDDGRVGVELTLPKSVGKHGYRRRGTRFFAGKESSQRWLCSEDLKKVADDFIT